MKFLLSIGIVIVLTCHSLAQDSQALINQAEKFNREQNDVMAGATYHKALEQSKKEGNWTVVQRCLIKCAAFGIFLGEPEQARKELDEFFFNEKKLHLSDSTLIADGYHYKGQYFHYFSYHSDSARYFYAKSLRTWESLHRTDEIAKNLIMLGDIERYYFHDYSRAEHYFERALPLLLSLNRKDYWLATVYYNLGTTYRSKGDYEKAMANSLEAIKIVDEIHDPLLRENCLSAISNIYLSRGQFDLAIESFRQTIEWNIRNNGSAGNRATANMNIGLCYQEKGMNLEAVKFFESARMLYRRDREDNTSLTAELLVNEAKSLGELNRLREAAQCYSGAWNIYKNTGRTNTKVVSILFFEMGQFNKTQGRLDSAIWYFHKSLQAPLAGNVVSDVRHLPSLESIGYRSYLFEPALAKAEVFMQLFRRSEKKDREMLVASVRHLTLAEQLLRSHRNSYDYQESKKRLSDKYHSLYELFVEAAFEMNALKIQGADTLLLSILENSKAKQLQENLQDVSAANSIGLPDSIVFRQHSIVSSQIFFTEKMSEEISRKKPDSTKIRYYRENLISLDLQALRLKEHLESEYPMFYSVRMVSNNPSLQSVVDVAKKKDITFLDYFWGDKTVYVMMITSTGISMKTIGSTDSIHGIILNLMNNLVRSKQSLTSQTRFDEFRDLSYRLHSILIGTNVKVSNGRLVIVPDGDLYQLPFEVLLSNPSDDATVNYKALPYLVMNNRIGYAYSLSSYLGDIPEPRKSPSVLAFAYAGQEIFSAAGVRANPNSLPGTEKELSAMRNTLGYGEFLYDDAATEERFKKSAPLFDILHLALHGNTGSHPLDTKLLFRHVQENQEDDTLFTNEIYAIKLKALLAVLSACETGIGKFDKGEGVSSVASAFAYAGCPRVVMSLWKVDDASAASLMDMFYRHLSQGDELNESLMQAKVRFITNADEFSAHPSFWAPFVLMGNEKAVFAKGTSSIYYLIPAFFLLMFFFFYLYKKRRTG